MLLRIGRDDKYVPGYWKTFPEAYARDAMVYERLLEQSHPKLAKHLRQAGVVPEAYVSKWYAGSKNRTFVCYSAFTANEKPSDHHHAAGSLGAVSMCSPSRHCLTSLRRTSRRATCFCSSGGSRSATRCKTSSSPPPPPMCQSSLASFAWTRMSRHNRT